MAFKVKRRDFWFWLYRYGAWSLHSIWTSKQLNRLKSQATHVEPTGEGRIHFATETEEAHECRLAAQRSRTQTRGQWGTSAWRRLDYGRWITGGAVYTSLGDLDGGLGGGPIQWEFSPEARPVYHSKYLRRTPMAFCQKGERNHSETAQSSCS